MYCSDKERDLIHKWMWMQGMEYVCNELSYWAAPKVPDNRLPKDPWHDIYKHRFEHVLSVWDETVSDICDTHEGWTSPDSKYCIGITIQTKREGIEVRYSPKNIEIIVRWAEVKSFITDMVSPDKQISMFDLLLDKVERTEK